MKITCVGGGPTGTFFAILAKLRDPRHEVTVVERNVPGATHGWGVAWGDELLDDMHAFDPVSARNLRALARVWNGQKVYIGDHPVVHLGGRYGYSVNRARMQDILTARARQLGVVLRYGETVEDETRLDADLVVACDGVGSRLRTRHEDTFGTSFTPGRNRYIWLGTSKVFDTFQWHFRRTEAGWIWCWVYASAQQNSTFIVECAPDTWTGLFGSLDHAAQLRRIDEIFSDALDGHPVMDPPEASTPSEWVVFREIRNRSWHHGNLALAGDSAHTTHFGIGSGTSLGLQDAIVLSRLALDVGTALPDALAAYSRLRRAEVERVQEAALLSMRWFEEADERLDRDDPVKIAYSLFDRRRDQPPWRYQVHLATQIQPLRQVRQQITTARRSVRASHRDRPR